MFFFSHNHITKTVSVYAIKLLIRCVEFYLLIPMLKCENKVIKQKHRYKIKLPI